MVMTRDCLGASSGVACADAASGSTTVSAAGADTVAGAGLGLMIWRSLPRRGGLVGVDRGRRVGIGASCQHDG